MHLSIHERRICKVKMMSNSIWLKFQAHYLWIKEGKGYEKKQLDVHSWCSPFCFQFLFRRFRGGKLAFSNAWGCGFENRLLGIILYCHTQWLVQHICHSWNTAWKGQVHVSWLHYFREQNVVHFFGKKPDRCYCNSYFMCSKESGDCKALALHQCASMCQSWSLVVAYMRLACRRSHVQFLASPIEGSQREGARKVLRLWSGMEKHCQSKQVDPWYDSVEMTLWEPF